MRKFFIIFLLSSLVFASCKKPETTPNNGIYHGLLYRIGNNGDTVGGGVVDFALFEANSAFSMAADSVSHTPAQHNGDFTIQSSSLISFTNKSPVTYHPDGYLDTVFNYTFDNVNFHLWVQKPDVLLDYKLVRK
ncbi:MAG: hypothetical protein R2780_13290 [Crocinitomicaceae bacterium]|nr:hypothetical protein [Crocinitomicaceae bacterium]